MPAPGVDDGIDDPFAYPVDVEAAREAAARSAFPPGGRAPQWPEVLAVPAPRVRQRPVFTVEQAAEVLGLS